jgi:hypothetical protein
LFFSFFTGSGVSSFSSYEFSKIGFETSLFEPLFGAQIS